MQAKRPYHKRPKRIGRGVASGHGKTSTKGHKGQRARSGFHQRAGFEGGQNPLYRRLPKRGFNQANHKLYAVMNLDRLAKLGWDEVSPKALLERGVVKDLLSGLKILGQGKLARPVVVKAHSFSVSAKAAIEKAGGKAVLLSRLERDAQSSAKN